MTLVVDALSCARGGVPILTGVGFALAPGEGLVLRGPNGSGKTTLLRALAGLTPPVAGRIDAPEDAIAYAGHADGLKAQLSVAENLDMGAYTQRDRAEVRRTMEEVHTLFPVLAERANVAAGSLSGGEQMMVAIGRALLAKPKFVL